MAEDEVTTLQVMTDSEKDFALLQREAQSYAVSEMVPKAYQNSVPNVMIAIRLARSIGADPYAVMQNVHIIHGKPGWSSTFIIAAISSCGRFSPLRFKMEGEGDTRSCTAWARDTDMDNDDVLEGPAVSMKMAKDEGWSTKSGSKWKTMPELMLRYRAAAFFGRLYAPDVLMGLHTSDEAEDVTASREPRAAESIALLSPEVVDVEVLDDDDIVELEIDE